MKPWQKRVVLALPFGALLALAWAQGTEPGVRVVPVGGAVSCLQGRGGNIGLSIGEDGVLMVDDQFPDSVAAIEEAIDGLSDAEPVFLINTHWHGDHTGGNAHFGKGATIFAHDNVRLRLEGREGEPARLPVVTYEDGLSIHFNGEEIRVFHVPTAHTDGDSVVWFTGSKAVHMGDLYFQVGYPYIDASSGGNALGLVEGLRSVLERLPEDVRVIPGHGKVGTLADLREYYEMLETLTQRIEDAYGEGESVAAMLERGITRDYDERWGSFSFVPPERFVASVVASLEAAR